MRLLSLALSAIVAIPLFAVEKEFTLVPAQECRPRTGLPHFFTKAATPGAEVRIGYLGGSITAQNGWRPKTLAHFQKTFPEAKFSEINAAIGGTGSDLGVFRVKQDVLDHKPDLLFVEFAVNDGGASPDQIYRCMEGIVRQTWRALPECDICFVYTLTEALYPAMKEGNFQRSASAMEKIADHYGIPSIHMGMEVTRLAKEGTLVWRGPLPKTDEEKALYKDKVVFSRDSVHPHVETGHELYLAAIVRSLDPIKAASKSTGQHVIPEPFIETHYERAQMLPITQAKLSPGFIALDAVTDPFGKRWAKRMKALHKGSQPGETITFKFKGTRCAIFDVIGPDGGQVIVTLDSMPPKIVPRFDAHCTYHRLSTMLIGSGLEDTVHTVKIEIHPEQPDKTAILAINKNVMDKPERYNATTIYPGAILLVGEIIQEGTEK
ncbi:GDSL-like lipase/acylhydrolase family protein [Prosthecobacter fusiformis]|uniref:GDSL-like lipase/acylhydrolase family protein n=1 Tax=Prosthecobacter fusiformis TaxID=48464 RepID=A0A4V3FE63_9BACT|nr:SGNH/GDSL hydrolase family protein [Prosthecobacter fusiformis]TDU64650.1 GDSL-like lipase/acylhydrolase family protein [Prosthecobacter fusiformis]